jgi:cell division protein FtsB
MIETSKNREIAELKVTELQEAKKELTYDIENLKTNQGLEENIREKFGLAKEGEGLIIVVDNKENVNLNEETKQNWLISLFNKWFK